MSFIYFGTNYNCFFYEYYMYIKYFLVNTNIKNLDSLLIGGFKAMVSLCIKTNKKNIIDCLIKNITSIHLDDIVFTKRNFSKYSNVIVHYLGANIPEFYNELSSVITNCIIENYEQIIVHKLLLLNYFYFDNDDFDIIETNCQDILLGRTNLNISSIENDIIDRKHYLWADVLRYLSYNKSIILDGFITFRIADYIKCVDSIVDFSVNQFVINREYTEFINMLKLYINSKIPESELVHLVYVNEESILLDKNKNIISLTKNNLDKCYLSDISFSSNDYALNSLLTLLPKKIIIHLIGPMDDFINTLQTIFGDNVTLCTDCNICEFYKALNKQHGS